MIERTGVMTFFLGIDGGTLKTEITVINAHKDIIFECVAGPTAVNVVDLQTIKTTIRIALKPFLDANQNCYFDAAFIGLDGLNFFSEAIEVESVLHALSCFNDESKLYIRHNMENALYAGRCFEEGIALIAGTRMMAFGKDLFRTHRTGGWGYKEGEIGSSYALGMSAIRYATRCYDGRYDIDAFAMDIAKAIGLNEASDIIQVMADFYERHSKIASLAPIVTKHANNLNPYAMRIVDRATEEIALAVKGVYRHLKLKNKTLVISGGLGNSGGYFKDQLEAKILAIDPDFRIIKPLLKSSQAAALMAKRLSK